MSNIRDINRELDQRGRALRGPVDNGGGPPHDGDMDARVTKLETDFAAIKIDIGVIKLNGAAKSDIADLRAATKTDIADLRAATKSDIAELRSAVQASAAGLERDMEKGHTRIIMWVVGAIIFAQVLPLLKEFIR